MTRRWPDTLPGVITPGYSLSPVDPALRTDMEVGEPRVRRLTFARRDRSQQAWRFSDTEMGTFRAWHEDAVVSLAGDSDSIAHWSRTNAPLSVGAGLSPDLIPADRLLASAVNGLHNASLALPDAAIDGLELVAWATLQAAGVTQAKLVIIGRDGVYRGVEVNLTTGATGAVDAGVTYVVKPRGTGWRVELRATVGAGSATPQLRVALMDGAGSNSWTGNGLDGVDVSETQVRIVTGHDLFVPCDADGKARGAAGGTAWFLMTLPVGGGWTRKEARFAGMYNGVAGPGLTWRVEGEVMVRNA
jgi:hypothetical protein